MTDIKPFKNESDALTVDGLNVQNRLDRVSIFGSLDITRDHVGLGVAQQLSELLNMIVKELESDKNLPDVINTVETDTVDNPFFK